MKKLLSLGGAVLAAAFLSGCAGTRDTHHSSSVVSYLYPGKKPAAVTPSVPRLELPLTVGIAFVPEVGGRHHSGSFVGLTEQHRMELMKEVGDHFKQYEFVKSVELIPSAYLKSEGSFANLDQIRTMYNVDVIALLSYDYAQFTDEGIASLTYWTLVGAYVIPGEKNSTHTMLDAAVYDIRSRKMLFRAPGVNQVKSKATPINLSEQLRKDGIKSFNLAKDDLITNLDLQLGQFKEKVKENPEAYQVVHKPGYTGGGSFGGGMVILAFGFLVFLFLGKADEKGHA